jgi:prolyl-tRNA synthetase
VLTGHKTPRERFAGAIRTWTCEGMMGDGKALQMGTSHELGQNFAKAFGTQFSSAEGTQDYVWQTSWGASTRLIGGLIMMHGDDAGLRLPPNLAPTQVVVLLVRDEEGTRRAAEALVAELVAAGHRVRLDDRVEVSFGRRAVAWELKGVPVRVEVGPRDLAEGTATVVRRDDRSKRQVPVAGVAAAVTADLLAAQDALLAEATAARLARTVRVETVAEAVAAAADGFAVLPWSTLGEDGETALAAEGVTVRCLQTADGGLGETDDAPDLFAVVAKAY